MCWMAEYVEAIICVAIEMSDKCNALSLYVVQALS